MTRTFSLEGILKMQEAEERLEADKIRNFIARHPDMALKKWYLEHITLYNIFTSTEAIAALLRRHLKLVTGKDADTFELLETGDVFANSEKVIPSVEIYSQIEHFTGSDYPLLDLFRVVRWLVYTTRYNSQLFRHFSATFSQESGQPAKTILKYQSPK